MTAITFRPLSRADFALLAVWLAEPHVQTWWKDPSAPDAVEADYAPMVDGDDPGEGFIVELDGEPFGYIQRYRLSDEAAWAEALAITGAPLNAASIDYLIGRPDGIGLGVGPALISRFIDDVWQRYEEVDAIVVSVSQGNRRSWRALEMVGFTRTWSGQLDTGDPSDVGPSHVYVLWR